MKRRTFIKTGIVLAGLGLLSLLTIPSFKDTVIKMLRKDTSQLKINQNSIDKFMKDANKEQFWVKFSRGKKYLLLLLLMWVSSKACYLSTINTFNTEVK
ncbi:MAG: hypothetical protein R2804_10010 [Cyclobacteriaceae bacterium]